MASEKTPESSKSLLSESESRGLGIQPGSSLKLNFLFLETEGGFPDAAAVVRDSIIGMGSLKSWRLDEDVPSLEVDALILWTEFVSPLLSLLDLGSTLTVRATCLVLRLFAPGTSLTQHLVGELSVRLKSESCFGSEALVQRPPLEGSQFCTR